MNFSNSPISPTQQQNEETAKQNQSLLGKVVLLIGNDTAVLQTLITQLAQKGADIALICRKLPSETVQRVKESVEALERRFLFIETSKTSANTFEPMLQTVTAGLGPFDVLIDLSAQKTETVATLQQTQDRSIANAFQPNWRFMQAAYKGIAHAEPG